MSRDEAGRCGDHSVRSERSSLGEAEPRHTARRENSSVRTSLKPTDTRRRLGRKNDADLLVSLTKLCYQSSLAY